MSNGSAEVAAAPGNGDTAGATHVAGAKRKSEASELEEKLHQAIEARGFLKTDNETEWISNITELIQEYGPREVENWHERKNKHKHHLVHLAVSKTLPKVLKFLCTEPNAFDINLQRASDQCTPMHLAMFYRKPPMIDMIQRSLNPDLTLKNSYGDSCDEKFRQFVESKDNLIFLDLEMTYGFSGYAHDKELEKHPRILEAALVITDKTAETVLDQGEWVCGEFSKEFLEKLPEFHQKHFRDAEPGGEFPPLASPGAAKAGGGEGAAPAPVPGGNGLFSAMRDEQRAISTAEMESRMLKMISARCPEGACRIVGQSVQCDREVLMLHMPRLYNYLNHRIVDISSIIGMLPPETVSLWHEDQHAHANYNHRALQDCLACVRSYQWLSKEVFGKLTASAPAEPAESKAPESESSPSFL